MPETPDTTSLSRRQALVYGGGLAAAAAVGSVATAGSAAADGSSGHPVEMHSISLKQAKNILREAERKAREIGVPMFIVIVDVCGDVKASSRQDGNARAALVLAPLKANTALAFGTATADLAAGVAEDPVRLHSFLAAGFTLLGGGLPIVSDEMVLGAIGVGGGSPAQDIEVAEAGLATLG